MLRVTNKDFTVLLAGQRYMLVALRCQFAKIDFLIVHAPHAWATNGKTLQQAIDEAVEFWDDLFVKLNKVKKRGQMILMVDANTRAGRFQSQLIGDRGASAGIGRSLCEVLRESGHFFALYFRQVS